MRVLFVNSSPYPPELYAGVEVSTHWLCQKLISRGHAVCVAAPTHLNAADLKRMSATSTKLNYPIFRGRRAAVAMVAALNRFNPNVVVMQEQSGKLGEEWVPRLKGIGLVHYQHGAVPPMQLPEKLSRRAVWLTCSASTAWFFLSEHRLSSIVVPPVFAMDRFAGMTRQGNHALFVSLQSRKGVEIAIEIARNRPDVPFLFVETWTRDRAATQDFIKAISRLPNAKVLKNQSDMSPVFAATKLILTPSRSREGWGCTMAEAQAWGIPALASSRGQLPASVGQGGLTLDPDDPLSDWLQAFDRIWNDDAFYAELSAHAKRNGEKMIAQIPAALDRFEEGMQLATQRHDVARVTLLRKPTTSRKRAAVALSDLAIGMRLAGSFLSARLLPPARWGPVTLRMARLAAIGKRGKPKAAAAMVRALGVPAEPHAAHLATRLAGARYELGLQCLRGLGGGWAPTIAVDGLDHLDEALAKKHGAVLWVAHFVFAANVVKMGLYDRGYSLFHMSRPEHGFSKTRLGIRILNPLRTAFENRYLEGRIVIQRQNPNSAMRAALDVLSNNGIVSTTAGDWEGAHVLESPFLGGSIRLSAGPVWFAEQTGAALLPVIGVKTAEPDQFTVRIEKPLAMDAALSRDDRWRHAVAEFLARLGPAVLRYPDQWRGWSSLSEPRTAST